MLKEISYTNTNHICPPNNAISKIQTVRAWPRAAQHQTKIVEEILF